ncbi:SSU ribosomal protein S3AE [Archaeoglobus sulfaticallidus PM70-1]|uniref:Small ribosomal subunit protein eS1 n=1 Tax=Archaeoglobus sulfaticallidus PM70-1 TaxID=387631 RepID=N0BKK9_9EURY|nr:30S ribosomal protein S3ae [Archaeoglobus sulfaticallidus]AGK61036.1 SSU ribosomal protein S3AE [Archaeoglobus sulfaticallidus PM70-1]
MSGGIKTARKRQARVKDKWTLKKWFTLIAPEYFGMSELGVTPADASEKVLDRVVEVTLAELTNDYSNQNPYKKLCFKVYRVAGNNAYTEFFRYELGRDYINSLTRRRTSKIEDVIDVTTTDGYVLRVKPVAFTIRRCKTSQRRAIRAIMHEIIAKTGSESKFIQFIQECILGKIPSEIYKNAKKIYPLRRVEIRKIELLKEPKGIEKGVFEEAKAKEEEVKAEEAA